MSTLPELLRARMSELQLSEQQAAMQIGINAAMMERVLAGESFPNKKTIESYASFLLMGAEELLALKVSGTNVEGGTRRVGRPRKQVATAAAVVTLDMHGNKHGFNTLDELQSFLSNQSLDLKVSFMNKDRVFASIEDVLAWIVRVQESIEG